MKGKVNMSPNLQSKPSFTQLFTSHPCNTKRQLEIDLAKVIAIFFMALEHTESLVAETAPYPFRAVVGSRQQKSL